ncbi:uncharacterized protein LOC129766324 [Toxorhynchites rutilus septentrionalis]|uniref:uncharacterized protein LOC129766324 n=1 Tax=Toxorhynchites rutilus septentrionalis TaxID=329112 RepID=UPI00247B05A3|nr:uncharacterized protein LOC129766324 [Toxorhynchites rutilus septentrionalis]
MKNTHAKGGAAGGTGAQSGSGDGADMAEYNTLSNLRGLAKGKIIRLYDMLERVDEEQTQLTSPQVKVYIKKLDAAYKEFHNYHERIVAVVAHDRKEDQDCEYVEFETLYDNVSIFLETWLENFAAPDSRPATGQPVSQQPLIVQQSLPRAIPTFDGKYEQWEKFKIMFGDVVNKSNEPPRIKLYHLEKALIGDAAGLIDAKTIADGNYDRAWEILRERFEDKRRMIDRHIVGLLSITKIVKEDHCELRKLIDTCVGHVENLKFLGQEFSGVSELIVIHILTSALDKESKRAWESSMEHGSLPHYNNTISFLKNRISILERCQVSTISNENQFNRISPKRNEISNKQPNSRINAAMFSTNCEFCEGDHFAFKCPSFNALKIDERLKMVRDKRVCFNCLRRGHRGLDCPSYKSCSKCKRRHHSLLHREGVRPSFNIEKRDTLPENQKQHFTPSTLTNPYEGSSKQDITAAYSNTRGNAAQQVLLLTAQVFILDKHGNPHICRALLDSGSQINFVSESLLNKLGVHVEETNILVTGVSNIKSKVQHKTCIQVLSRFNNFRIELDCLVSRKVTGILPTYEIDVASWNIPSEMQLADPSFYQPGQIDLLIGMEWFDDLIKSGRVKLFENSPTLIDSQFGWLIGGRVDGDSVSGSIFHSHTAISSDEQLNKQIQRFWELENVASEQCVPTEAEECEAHFQSTFRRNSEGRYVVQLPLKETCKQLGDSRQMAIRRFYMMESKLCKQPEIKQQYDEFIEEYVHLGHCKEINEKQDKDGIQKWYLPHHAVLRPSSSSTKCRVVFDASAKVGGRSLNDEMMIGPTIQPDLLTIILRFRKHRYVLSADIAKMYRQVLVDSCHTPLQRILWRKNPMDQVKVLELQTVTYGMAAAPFLAIRALNQLSKDEEVSYPRAAEVVKKTFYVDNVLFGGTNLEEVVNVQQELISLLKLGGFHLHKWAANNDQLLEHIAEKDLDKLVNIEGTSANEIIKTLGLMWDPNNDELIFLSQPDCATPNPTKRQVLSMIARLFDPLGLLSPVIVIAKMLMQQLWREKIGWDDKINEELTQQWKEFLAALPTDGQFRIPRQVFMNDAVKTEIHGFADASIDAYGACIYIRSLYDNGTANMRLITSKSKVCPITPLTIPRKELLAALLLHRLAIKVVTAMELEHVPVVLWSDSQVVLAWFNKPLERLQIFVRNRISEIKSNDTVTWKYVRSADNPADIVSRGMSSEALANNRLWWNGPSFLRTIEYKEELLEVMDESEIPELKPETIANVAIVDETLSIFEKFDSFPSLSQGVFPDVWKHSFMFPVFKKGDKCNVANYRGITSLSAASKLFELIVNDAVFFKVKRYISPVQHGFMPGRSVSTNLLEFSSFCINRLEERAQVDAIYTDIKAAFDRIDHRILLRKLSRLGASDEFINWLRSYLSGRTLRVKLLSHTSSPFAVSSGVP